MFGTSPFFSEKDRRVKIYNNDVAVSSSDAQSQYSRYVNFIGDRFTVDVNTISPNIKTYDVSLAYSDKVIPYEGGVAKGSTPGYINFDGTQFDITSLVSDKYTVTNTAWGKVLVNTVTTPRILNFSSDFTVAEDIPNDKVNVGIGSGFLPLPYNKKWGAVMGGQTDLANDSFGDGLFNIPYSSSEGDVIGINNTTHGHARRYTTGSTDADTIEVTTEFPITRLAWNPHLYGKIALTTLDDVRFMIGFSSDAIPTDSNEYLDDLSGFMIGYQYDTAGVEDTNWQIVRNNGAASETKVSAGVSLSSTTPFTFELIGDAANSRWGWNINGGAFTYYTTLIPVSATDLRFTFRAEEIGDNESVYDLYYLYHVQDM